MSELKKHPQIVTYFCFLKEIDCLLAVSDLKLV